MIGKALTFIILGILARIWPKRYRLVPRLDGIPLLRQFKLTSWCYLQSFVNPETREWFHHHRWHRMYSIVLSGSFTEERYTDSYWVHAAPSVYGMDQHVYHRIEAVRPNTWTLFFMFKDQVHWGYRHRDGDDFMPWDEMIKPENRVEKL